MFGWINVEGIDGSGKTTFIERLEKHAKEVLNIKDVYVLKGLGTGMVGSAVREAIFKGKDLIDPLTSALAIASGHTDCINQIKKIKACCNDSLNHIEALVITDRSIPSYYGYNYKAQKNNWVNQLIQYYFEDPDMYNPDLTVVINTDYFHAQQRINKRKGEVTFFDQKDEIFFKDVYTGIIEFISKNLFNYVIINNNGSLAKFDMEMNGLFNKLFNVNVDSHSTRAYYKTNLSCLTATEFLNTLIGDDTDRDFFNVWTSGKKQDPE